MKEIQDAVTLPVMAKCRIGHFVEAQILQSLSVDFIDESEGIVLVYIGTSEYGTLLSLLERLSVLTSISEIKC